MIAAILFGFECFFVSAALSSIWPLLMIREFRKAWRAHAREDYADGFRFLTIKQPWWIRSAYDTEYESLIRHHD